MGKGVQFLQISFFQQTTQQGLACPPFPRGAIPFFVKRDNVPDGLDSSTHSLSLRCSSTHHQMVCTPLSGLRALHGARQRAQADRVSNHGSHGDDSYPDAGLPVLLLNLNAI